MLEIQGLYEPWKHPHEHHDPMYKFSVNEKGDTVAVDVETGEPLGDNE